jgi:hypothetical protein
LELLAIAAALLCVVVSVSALRFQRFTLSISRAIMSGEGSDKIAGDI